MSEQSPIEDPQPDDAWNELVKTITSAANDDKLLELHQQIEPSKWDQYIDSLTSDGAKIEVLQSYVKPDGTFIDNVLQATYPNLPLDTCDTLIQKTQKEFPLTSEWIATSGPNANEAPRLESVMQGTFTFPFIITIKTRIWGGDTNAINPDVKCTMLHFEKDSDVLDKAINERNIRLGWPSPFELPMLNLQPQANLLPSNLPQQTGDLSTTIAPFSVRNLPFGVHTGQEFGALSSSMIDGRTGVNWITDPQENARIYGRAGSGYLIKLSADRDDGAITSLETLTGKQDIDGFLATCVIACALIQEIDRDPTQKITGLLFDLAEIGKKIGFDPRSSTDTQNLREKVFAWFSYLTRAQVIGERSIPYFDKTTKQKIDTRIEAPMLQILEKQQPIQPGLFGEAPTTMLVALSPAWRNILCNTDLQQYLPYAERIAAIPPRQPGGAWARSIGMSLLNFWRKNIGKTIKPTRRELLAMEPSVSTPRDVLNSDKPKRATEYWHKAMRELVDRNIIADMGEARRTQEDQLSAFDSRQGWSDEWFNEAVDIQPATDMQNAISALAKNKYLPRPTDLSQPKRRGRPRKALN